MVFHTARAKGASRPRIKVRLVGGVTIEGDSHLSLEKALAKTQSDAEALMKAAAAVSAAAKRLRAAAQVGKLREMRRR